MMTDIVHRIRGLASYALYLLGDLASIMSLSSTGWPFGRLHEWAMLASSDMQRKGEWGPWRDIG